MCKRGFIFREGIVDINAIKDYAKKNKAVFFDLRRIGFTNLQQLEQLLSRYLSNVLKRPTRISINKFFNGFHNKTPFFAVLPHNFLNELLIFIKDQNLTIDLTQKLMNNEESCLGLLKQLKN